MREMLRVYIMQCEGGKVVVVCPAGVSVADASYVKIEGKRVLPGAYPGGRLVVDRHAHRVPRPPRPQPPEPSQAAGHMQGVGECPVLIFLPSFLWN